jgi:hypothetical protein
LEAAAKLEEERKEIAIIRAECDERVAELNKREEDVRIKEASSKLASEQRLQECDRRERLLTRLEDKYQAKDTELAEREEAVAASLKQAEAIYEQAKQTENRSRAELVEAFTLFDKERNKVLRDAATVATEMNELMDLTRRLQLVAGDSNARFRFRSSVLRDMSNQIESKHRESLAIEACSLFPVASAQLDRVEFFGKALIAIGMLAVVIFAILS